MEYSGRNSLASESNATHRNFSGALVLWWMVFRALCLAWDFGRGTDAFYVGRHATCVEYSTAYLLLCCKAMSPLRLGRCGMISSKRTKQSTQCWNARGKLGLSWLDAMGVL